MTKKTVVCRYGVNCRHGRIACKFWHEGDDEILFPRPASTALRSGASTETARQRPAQPRTTSVPVAQLANLSLATESDVGQRAPRSRSRASGSLILAPTALCDAAAARAVLDLADDAADGTEIAQVLSVPIDVAFANDNGAGVLALIDPRVRTVAQRRRPGCGVHSQLFGDCVTALRRTRLRTWGSRGNYRFVACVEHPYTGADQRKLKRYRHLDVNASGWGKAEDGENDLACALRETAEECGICLPTSIVTLQAAIRRQLGLDDVPLTVRGRWGNLFVFIVPDIVETLATVTLRPVLPPPGVD